MPDIECSAPKNQFKFYLILKGEILIFTDQAHQCLRLFAPELPVHAYTAGPWLAGTPIPRHRKLELKCVQHGTDTPQDHGDFLFIFPRPKPHRELTYFEIVVPFPQKISHGALQKNKDVLVTITHDDGTTETHSAATMCLVAILEYGWDGHTAPFLQDSASPELKWSSGGGLCFCRSLHVSAAGDTQAEELDPTHARNAFQQAAGLLDIKADIDFAGGPKIVPQLPPPGLSYFEVNLSYFETLQLAQSLGELLQGGVGQIPPPEPRAAVTGNCGPMGG